MKTRVISAICMIAILLPLLIVGGELFAFLVGVIGCFALRELLQLFKKEKNLPFLTEVLAYLTVLYLIWQNYDSNTLIFSLDYRVLVLLLFIFFVPTVLLSDNKKYSFQDGLSLLGSTLLIGFAFHLFIVIRNYSLNTFIYLILITTMTDTFALLTGMWIGKTKLCPAISPKKTVEGLIGGTFMGSFLAILFYLTVIDAAVPFHYLLIVTVTLSLVGQLGDLVFSQIKRYYNVKDFSNLIPGHGGILDRLDSIIFVVMMYTMFISII